MNGVDDLYPLYLKMLWGFLAIVIWQTPWKCVALWRAARNRHLWWFIAVFLVNTLAILEIIYIFGFSKKKKGKIAIDEQWQKEIIKGTSKYRRHKTKVGRNKADE